MLPLPVLRIGPRSVQHAAGDGGYQVVKWRKLSMIGVGQGDV